MAPCLDTAAAYRKAQLPHRVDDPASSLGHRRTKPGENLDGADLFPVCEGFEALDSFGLGLSLYFRQLGFLFGIVCLSALILCPSTAHNARACKHRETEDRNAGLASGTAAGCFASDLRIGANIVPDILVCALILVAALVSNVIQDILAKRIDQNRQTPSDYAVMISNPPQHVLDPDAYKKFFAKFWDDDIVSVTIGKDNGALLSLMASRAAYLQDLSDFADGDLENREPAGLRKLLQPYAYALGFFKSASYAKAQLAVIEEQLQAYLGENAGGGWREPKTVVVTFAFEKGMQRALETFEVSAVRRIFSNVTGYESKNTPVAFEGTVLNVSRPVEPEELFWHNSHYKVGNRVARVLASFAVTAGALACFCLVAVYLEGKFPFALAVFVTVVNGGLPTFLKALTDAVEKHKDFGDQQDAMFLKLIVARWTNTAIAVFVSYGPRTRLSEAALNQIMLILLSDAFLAPLLRVYDPYDLFMRYVVSRGQPTQRACNRFWIGADWNIAERYTDVAKTLFVGLFYAAAAPNGLLVTAAALATTFAADRFCLLRRWARKPDFDDQISRRTIGVVSIVVLVHVVASLEFFENWGLYEEGALEDDAVYDKATMHYHSACFGNFLDCDPPAHKTLTAAQKFAKDVYPAVGAIALVLACWKFVGVEVANAFWYCCCGESAHDDDHMPISYRALPHILAYVPVVPHPLLGEPPLLAADVAGAPRERLPLPPNVHPTAHTICSRDVLRPLLPGCDDAKLDRVLADVYGTVRFYDEPAKKAAPPTPEPARKAAPAPAPPAPAPPAPSAVPPYPTPPQQPQYAPQYAQQPPYAAQQPGYAPPYGQQPQYAPQQQYPPSYAQQPQYPQY
ncbi:hypothetical protein JL720_12663 [Aureococcus anophagefferens]|nr:hypothetical protein JL720_12663 [Aureococcus anophagefferens]